MHPNNSDQVARGEGISRALRDALADPIGQSLPKKIRVEQATICYLLQETAAVRPASSRGSTRTRLLRAE